MMMKERGMQMTLKRIMWMVMMMMEEGEMRTAGSSSVFFRPCRRSSSCLKFESPPQCQFHPPQYYPCTAMHTSTLPKNAIYTMCLLLKQGVHCSASHCSVFQCSSTLCSLPKIIPLLRFSALAAASTKEQLRAMPDTTNDCRCRQTFNF